MKLQVTLALISVLLPKALTLECYRCIPDVSGTCTDTQTVCADRCGSATALVNTAGIEQKVSAKDCAVAAECVNGSLNLGLMKMTINTQCCTTDRCNTQVPAALPFGSPNGKKCYTCVNNDCTGTVSCLGGEDQCVSATATASGVQVTMKGCASRSLCTADASSMQAAGITGSVSCCEGNLCNSAEGVKLSLLIMLVPLISSVLFI
ncbi:ly6/PLAUR domain-containing protein 3-like [Colossoma macropomum]|uniref:ly6/PLAUR domain-containing protein 3-like n=1 Tax=Colossoma macropomum TaxID=42526 RepID=UPI001863E748|nr:ly6/PLAUR domain-containing protein 3-like [Colossoma macropomum]